MSRIKDYWEDVTLELFGCVTQETLDKARPIAQERLNERMEKDADNQCDSAANG